MLQYLVILLDDTAVSYCHCDNPHTKRRLINLDDLRAGIRYAMTENLMIQFVYPDYTLPQEYLDMIDTIDHHDIVPYPLKGDVMVVENGELGMENQSDAVYVVRVSKAQLFACGDDIAALLPKTRRLNVVITDLETFTDEELKRYGALLDQWASVLKEEYLKGRTPQLNLLTDRMMLTKSNHCNAGVENITLAPDGHFYLCPAFYYRQADSVGDLQSGPTIPNQQLLRLDHAPLCRHCDAYQCRRCVWMNQKKTHEVNTPSHEQCVVAHTERNAARRLLESIRKEATFMPDVNIKEINYLDPFDIRKEW